MTKKYFLVSLTAITLLAGSLRFFRLDRVPPSPNRDEAAIGYNAYSLLKTGRDEYGKRWPLNFQSFGDWKLPLYFYFSTLPVAVLGLKVVSVRLVSALAGTMAVALIGLLATELFQNRQAGLGAALILALNPWHLFFSHAGFETNLALTLLIGACWFFWRAFTKPKLLGWAYLLLGLTLFTYHGAHLFIPPLALALALFWLKHKGYHRWLFYSLLGFGIITVAAFVLTGLRGGQTKFGVHTIFNDPHIRYARIDSRRAELPAGDIRRRIFYNRFLLVPYQIGIHYLRHFSSQFLFETGGVTPGQNLVEYGNLLLIEGFFLIIGAYALIARKDPALKFIIILLLLAPLPGALTKDAPHSARTLSMVLPLVLISGYGLARLLDWPVSKPRFKLIAGLILLLFFANSLMFLESYFYHFPLNRARFWGYDYAALALSQDLYQQAQKVVVVDKDDFPYIFFLFFNHYDPARFQNEAVRQELPESGMTPVVGFAKFEFVDSIDWHQMWQSPNTLFVDRIIDSVDSLALTPDGTINLPDGEPILAYVYVPPDPCQKPRLIPQEDLSTACPAK